MAHEKLLDELLDGLQALATEQADDAETNWEMSQAYDGETKWRPFYHGKSFGLQLACKELQALVTEYRLKLADQKLSDARQQRVKEHVNG